MFCEEIVTLPFTNHQLQEKFSNVYDSYVIDYESSKLKDSGFLSYLRNASIEAVILNPSVNLMKNYINNNNTMPNTNLSAIHADLIFLYASKGQELHTGCIFDFFSKEQVDELLFDLEDVLSLQISLIESLPLYILLHCTKNNEIVDDLLKQSNILTVHDDILSKSGKTWITVACIPNFMSMLIQVKQTSFDHMVFYSCLEEYAFSGKNLLGALGMMRDSALEMFFSNMDYIIGA